MKSRRSQQFSQALPWIAFVLRIGLGLLFVVAGVLKVTAPDALAATIAAFRLVPPVVIAPMATFLPLFEIGLGLYLLVGLFTRIVGVIVLAQCLLFALAIASVVARGLSVSCGCFGQADTSPATWLDVVRDVLFAACTLPVILTEPNALSLDSYFAKRR